MDQGMMKQARTRVRHIVLALLSSFMLVGCTTAYVVAPAPVAIAGVANLTAAPLASESGTLDLLYVTDLKPADEDGFYGEGRSNSMAMGIAKIDIANQTVPDYLAYMLGAPSGDEPPVLELAQVEERVRFPGTPLPFAIEDGVVAYEPKAIEAYASASNILKSTLNDALTQAETGQVILYVPGFNNSFETSAFNLAELWTASDRTGVPVLFSWPTELSSPLNYFADTQDGAFSVYHLKETIRMIAATEGVKSVSIIAHSHGASIATTALRELLIEERGAGRTLSTTYRIGTLILAAPDIDLGVMEQRLITEAFGAGFGQINVYTNPDDDALGVAELVFGNLRFGSSRAADLSPESRAVISGIPSVHFISVQGAKGAARHNYFRLHPGVLADIGVTLRTGAAPGDIERPLTPEQANYWTLDATYQPRLNW